MPHTLSIEATVATTDRSASLWLGREGLQRRFFVPALGGMSGGRSGQGGPSWPRVGT